MREGNQAMTQSAIATNGEAQCSARTRLGWSSIFDQSASKRLGEGTAWLVRRGSRLRCGLRRGLRFECATARRTGHVRHVEGILALLQPVARAIKCLLGVLLVGGGHSITQRKYPLKSLDGLL